MNVKTNKLSDENLTKISNLIKKVNQELILYSNNKITDEFDLIKEPISSLRVMSKYLPYWQQIILEDDEIENYQETPTIRQLTQNMTKSASLVNQWEITKETWEYQLKKLSTKNPYLEFSPIENENIENLFKTFTDENQSYQEIITLISNEDLHSKLVNQYNKEILRNCLR